MKTKSGRIVRECTSANDKLGGCSTLRVTVLAASTLPSGHPWLTLAHPGAAEPWVSKSSITLGSGGGELDADFSLLGWS
jgi:hypothetical protein